MEALFNQFYDDVLVEKLNVTKAEKEDIKKKVLTNPAREIILSSSHKIFPNWVIEKLMCSTEMSHDELLKRLHQAKAFVHLKGESKSSIKHKLESIQDQYDVYSNAMSDYFKRRAKLFSLLVGVLLAFAANIDGLRIYETLSASPELRAIIISQQESLEKSYQLAKEKLDEVASGGTQTDDQKKQLEIIKSKLLAGSQQVVKLTSLGIPVGWRYFPVETGDETKGAHGLGDLFGSIINDPAAYLVWFFKALMTGLLIGLGAPFWFEIAQKLTKIKSGLKGRGATTITEDYISKPKYKWRVDYG